MHTHTYLGAMPTTQRTNFHTTRAHRRFDLWRICIITKPHHVCNFPSYYRTKVISNNKVLRMKVPYVPKIEKFFGFQQVKIVPK